MGYYWSGLSLVSVFFAALYGGLWVICLSGAFFVVSVVVFVVCLCGSSVSSAFVFCAVFAFGFWAPVLTFVFMVGCLLCGRFCLRCFLFGISGCFNLFLLRFVLRVSVLFVFVVCLAGERFVVFVLAFFCVFSSRFCVFCGGPRCLCCVVPCPADLLFFCFSVWFRFCVFTCCGCFVPLPILVFIFRSYFVLGRLLVVAPWLVRGFVRQLFVHRQS